MRKFKEYFVGLHDKKESGFFDYLTVKSATIKNAKRNALRGYNRKHYGASVLEINGEEY